MTRELFIGFSKSRPSMPNTVDRVAAMGNKIDVTFVFYAVAVRLGLPTHTATAKSVGCACG